MNMTSVNAMFSLAGQCALVTGASGSLGSRFAEVLLEAGAQVVGSGRQAEASRLQALAQKWPQQFVPIRLDVLDPASMRAMDTVLADVDVLINNAGVATSTRALDTEDASWARVQATNLDGPRRLSQAWAAARINENKGGAIVNVCSILGSRTMPGTAPYAVAKAGLLHLTRSLALEWARHGIRVNALSPGYIETSINSDYFSSDAGKAVVKRVPNRRLGQASDLDGALLLLASDAGRHMNGAEIVVDGGHAVSSL